MSLEMAIARIAELQSILHPPPPAQTTTPASASTFSGTLQSAQSGLGAGMAASPLATTGQTQALTGPAPGTPAGQAIVNLAQQEVGVAEQPPGSNDSPRIAQYRNATAGSGVGPWCAYFTSWAAPQAGDLIVWDEHIGVVKSVDVDGTIHTIEGNSSDRVSERTYAPGARPAIG